jgi:coenzyme F420-0:L-glutamate ligase/coenzyme F420-1:gamma-L-glutamate ligase
MSQQLSLIAIPGIPLVSPGDDLASLIYQALRAAELSLAPSDVLAVASKIVSKAEGRLVDLSDIHPTPEAGEIAEVCRKDPRLVQLVLDESREVSRIRPGLLITRHRLGFVCANAGIDSSNVGPPEEGRKTVLLLPLDPDASASRLRIELERLAGTAPAVVIVDSHGRPHRLGTVGIAIGAAGAPGLQDCRGRPDIFGRPLRHTEVGLGDLVASAATLLFGQADEQIPAVLLRGLRFETREGSAAELVRPRDLDMYR